MSGSLPIPEKSTSPIRMAATYETITPRSIGMIFAMPLPQMLNIITEANAIMAIGQLVAQFVIADGAKISPIEIIIGPVTTGGKKRITLFAPNPLIRPASKRYTSPAQKTPPQA